MSKLAFVFAGQGAQVVGMGKDFYDNVEESRKIFETANDVLGFDITKMCFEGPQEELNKTENTQPAILTTSIAILKAVEKRGLKPDVVAGLSLGEYSALVCSGAFSFEAAVALVKKRGKYMQEAVPQGVGGMAAIIGLSKEKIEEVCESLKEVGFVAPANFNCPGQIVIAGEAQTVDVACEKMKENGAKMAMKLVVSGPFHTKMLAPAAERLEKELQNIQVKDLNIPVVTNLTAKYINDKSEIKETLKQQVMNPVLWENSIKKMIEDGVDTFVEIGPGKVLSGFIKKIDRNVKIINVQTVEDLEHI